MKDVFWKKQNKKLKGFLQRIKTESILEKATHQIVFGSWFAGKKKRHFHWKYRKNPKYFINHCFENKRQNLQGDQTPSNTFPKLLCVEVACFFTNTFLITSEWDTRGEIFMWHGITNNRNWNAAKQKLIETGKLKNGFKNVLRQMEERQNTK